MTMTDEQETEGQAPTPGNITLTEDQLERLLKRASQEARGGVLPPGAYYDAAGLVWRKVPHPTGRINKKTGNQIYQERANRVMFSPDPSPGGQKKAQRQAKQDRLDYYHPVAGWLREGWCREVDAPENLGAGAERFDEYEVEMTADLAADGSTTTTVPGLPQTEDTTASTAPRRGPGRPRRGDN